MKYLIEQVNVGDTKTGVKNGREWKGVQIGIKIGGTWHNGMLFKQHEVDLIKDASGKEVDLELYDEEYQGKTYKKFKFPDRLKAIESRFAEIEEKITNLIARVTLLEDNGKTQSFVGGQAQHTETFDPKQGPPDDGPPDDDLPF